MDVVLKSRLFPMLVLFAGLLLTACDMSTMLPPDARLPDGSTYSGDMKDGYFHGKGVQTFPDGMVYRGEFKEGYWHGLGEITTEDGWQYTGEFEKGRLSGQGIYEDEDSRYEGEFSNGDFHGQGRYEVWGDVYIGQFREDKIVEGRHITEYGTYQGEFKDWDYHGEGTYAMVNDDGGTERLSGTWEEGVFVEEEEESSADSGPQSEYVPPALRTEAILREDQQRLNDQISRLASQQNGVADAYFLAVGGDGTESVFMRDIQVAKDGLQQRFDVSNRSIMLLNHRDYETLPLATRPAIERSLTALDEKMDPEEDLLVVHLVSHGGRDGDLVLRQPGVELPDLSPQDFADMLSPLDARQKLLVVSACYSGQWIDAVKDSGTWILTSAREDRTSFGCGDDSEMTWFTKALYKTVGFSLSNPDSMFEQIQATIREWEKEEGMEEDRWSYPQVYMGEGMRTWLSRTEQ